MATENSGSRSSSAVDSFIGSLISLTSKSEIRYEGILYNINTEESSIGLRSVRAFGTEGRKKDGPQIPPSDKIYEYILFRGSDIKDLQVKAAPPPVQPTPPINDDPAIIQSRYSQPNLASNILPSGVSGPQADLNSAAQMGLHGSGFQSTLPLYQPGGNVGSWGASPLPPSGNGSGLPMPIFWQGYYGPPNGLSHLHQQSLLQPTSLQQPMQYPNFSAPLPIGTSSFPGSKLPEVPAHFLSANTSSPIIAAPSLSSSPLTSTLLSTLPSLPSATLASEMLPSSLPNKAPIAASPTPSTNAGLPSLSSLSSSPELASALPTIPDRTNSILGQTSLNQSTSQSAPPVAETANSSISEKPTPYLVTPGQLLQPLPTVIPLSQPAQTPPKDVEVVQVSSSTASEQSVSVSRGSQPPILPLPVHQQMSQKPNGAPYHTHHGYWGRGSGRGRGRGAGRSHTVMKFDEEFDFTAMNEKFNKDEVWGHLGKSNKALSKEEMGDGKLSCEDGSQDGDDSELPKIQPVYNKDDFFDSLSCNMLDRESQQRRPKFSEQRKLDTETFGDFPRYQGGRGGRGPSRGSYRGRGYGYGYGYGYGGRGYGYGGRGGGRGTPYRP